jgi:hypothetical protein
MFTVAYIHCAPESFMQRGRKGLNLASSRRFWRSWSGGCVERPPNIAQCYVGPDHERLFSFRRSLHESFGHGYYSSGNPTSGLPARAFDFSFYSKERKG